MGGKPDRFRFIGEKFVGANQGVGSYYLVSTKTLHYVLPASSFWSFRGGKADEESVSQNVAILPEVFPKPMDFREADCHALRARNDRKIFLLIASSDRKVKFSIAEALKLAKLYDTTVETLFADNM